MLRFSWIIVLCLICTKSEAQEHNIIDADTVAYSIDLDGYIITAQHEPTHYTEAIHNIDIIPKEVLQKSGAVNLEQALAVSPAVRLYQDPILGTSLRLRGVSASNVAILVDGVPVIGRLGGAIDLTQLSIQNTERIEIVQGPLSYLYGSNAAGGVINIITKSSQVDPWKMNIMAQAESIKQNTLQANVGYQKEKWTVGAYGRLFEYKQYPVDSLRLLEEVLLADSSTILRDKYPYKPKKQKNIGGHIRYDINEENHIVAKYDRSHEVVTNHGSIKRPQWMPYANEEDYITYRNDAKLQYQGKIKNKHIEAAIAHNRYDRYNEENRLDLESNTLDEELRNIDTTYFQSWFGRLNIAREINEAWTSTVGMTYNYELGGGDRIINKSNSDSTKASFYEIAPYLDIKYNWRKKLSLSLATRYIGHQIYANKWIGSIHAKYNLRDDLSLRASYAQGYRSPSLKELYLEFIDINHYLIGNSELQPENSDDWQATLSYLPNNNWELSFNSYYLDIEDRISFAAFEPLKFQYQNISNYSVYGFQPSANFHNESWKIASSFNLGYWSTQLRLDEGPQYGRVWDMNNSVQYTWSKYRLSSYINHRYNGSQPQYDIEDDEVQISRIKAYHLIDASLNYSWRMAQFTIGARNLGNIKATETGSGSGGHGGGSRRLVGIGRSYFVKVGLSL